MTEARRLAAGMAFVTWIFCWSVLHGARSFFSSPAPGIPTWLVALLGAVLFTTISTGVTAVMRIPAWPWLAMASAVLLMAAMLGAHYAELRATAEAVTRAGGHATGATIASALRRLFKSGIVQVLFFVVSPIILMATGIMGWLWGPRHFLVEGAHGA